MNSSSNRRRLIAILVAAAFAGPALAQQGFPSGTVRIVLPFPPGGSSDGVVRHIAEHLSKKWGHPVVIENKPGGNTVPATDTVARSAPDGHTIGMVTGPHIINPFLISKLPYDTLKDLTGVMILTRIQVALYAHPSFPANNIGELVALAKKEPGKISYGHVSTMAYLGMELFNQMAGTRMGNVPYKGSSQAQTDLIGGHLQLLVDPVLQSTVEQAKAGKLKIIGNLGEAPSPLTPNASLPGNVVPGYEFSSFFGLVVRGGTPAALVRRIRDDFRAVMELPAVRARIIEMGQEPVASTPEEFNAYILEERKKWAPIVQSTGVKLN